MKKFFQSALIFLGLFFLTLIVTFPKSGLWFQIEKELAKSEIVVDGETLSSNPIFLKVSDGTIFFSEMELAQFSEIKIFPLLFYNIAKFQNLQLGNDIKQFGNFEAETLEVEYSVTFPTKIFISANGNFGELKGRINILERKIDLLLFPNKKLKRVRAVMKHFRKHKNGGYVYNGKF